MKFICFLGMCASCLSAHFGVVMPSDSSVGEDNAKMQITYKFSHPFEQNMMNLEMPNEIGVFNGEEKIAFSQNLTAKKDGENQYFTANFEAKEPKIYQFYMDPKPYFEPSEDCFIRHLTKSVVDAYGYNEDWDKPIGLKAEIIPLTRPYGLYTGNEFRAKVLYKGAVLKNAVVEVEYENTAGLKAPSEDHITQEVKTDENGIFSFVMPKAGWWGFAALSEDDEKISRDGKEYPVEIGAVIWVQTKDYQK